MSKRRHAVFDVLDELSNEEIRNRILVHGGPNLPVTDQTRGRLLEVLREYIDKSKQHSHQQETKNLETNAPKCSTRNNDVNIHSSPRPSITTTPVYEDDIVEEIEIYERNIAEVFPLKLIVSCTLVFMFSIIIYYVVNKLMYHVKFM
ncbi:uncharacterized protein LOC128712706 [Anopheles marshallii]|uniref:uncharacterized protein LOC128712706 n=1 Tax=Anopheles marshallii TaxID=1521116 RepID=UPI00237C3AC5|nr:uncharacterized protein LOC128712706 [Anopheles marshallii]